jgi:hypothetical protein
MPRLHPAAASDFKTMGRSHSRKITLLVLTTAITTALVVGGVQAVTALVTEPRIGGDAAHPLNFPPERVTPAAGTTKSKRVPIHVDGAEWSITTFVNQLGELCAGINVPDEGQGLSCFPEGDQLLGADLRIFPGSRQKPGGDLRRWDFIWVWGFTSPKARSIEIVRTDCSRQTVTPDELGVFLYVAGSAVVHEGIWPHRVEARSITGEVVASEQIRFEPPDTDEARAAHMKAPVPPSSCA